jgi:lipopolysaccharide transport system ATP-binding protein
LLSLIAAVYPATSSHADVTGSIVLLLGLNAGADSDLAAVDNINLLLRISGENRRLQS